MLKFMTYEVNKLFFICFTGMVTYFAVFFIFSQISQRKSNAIGGFSCFVIKPAIKHFQSGKGMHASSFCPGKLRKP